MRASPHPRTKYSSLISSCPSGPPFQFAPASVLLNTPSVQPKGHAVSLYLGAVMRDLENIDVDVRGAVIDGVLLRTNRRRRVRLATAIGGIDSEQQSPSAEVNSHDDRIEGWVR